MKISWALVLLCEDCGDRRGSRPEARSSTLEKALFREIQRVVDARNAKPTCVLCTLPLKNWNDSPCLQCRQGTQQLYRRMTQTDPILDELLQFVEILDRMNAAFPGEVDPGDWNAGLFV